MNLNEIEENLKYILNILYDEYIIYTSMKEKLHILNFIRTFKWKTQNNVTKISCVDTNMLRRISDLQHLGKYIFNNITSEVYSMLLDKYDICKSDFDWNIYTSTLKCNMFTSDVIPKYLLYMLEQKISDLLIVSPLCYLKITNEHFDIFMRRAIGVDKFIKNNILECCICTNEQNNEECVIKY